MKMTRSQTSVLAGDCDPIVSPEQSPLIADCVPSAEVTMIRGVCVKSCPMDIRISDYIKRGQRVLSTECIVCFECVNGCAKGALDMSFGLDIGKLDKRR
jgi:ferredoxin